MTGNFPNSNDESLAINFDNKKVSVKSSSLGIPLVHVFVAQWIESRVKEAKNCMVQRSQEQDLFFTVLMVFERGAIHRVSLDERQRN